VSGLEQCHALENFVHSLRDGPQRVTNLAQATELSQATVSRHLTALRNCGVVTAQRRGQEIIYHISNPKIMTVCDLVRQVLAEQIAHQSDMTKKIVTVCDLMRQVLAEQIAHQSDMTKILPAQE
jgi:DNA-binding transcriptional ArsR family regulator